MVLSFGMDPGDRERDLAEDNYRLRAEIDRLRAENERLTQQLSAAKEYAERLREALEEVSGLINESSGVYGLHLNGDPSPWEELLPGGKFEWLASFDEAIALPMPWDKTDVAAIDAIRKEDK
jgi:hypothetical protein